MSPDKHLREWAIKYIVPNNYYESIVEITYWSTIGVSSLITSFHKNISLNHLGHTCLTAFA
jgi:hypothetical protein